MSCKDLFAKRGHEGKSNETGSSKAPILFSPGASPQTKKVKLNPSVDTFVSDVAALPIADGYEVDAHPTHFAPLLDDLLFPQTMEVHSTRRLKCIIEESSGYIFHVSIRSLFIFVALLLFSFCRLFF